jgi:hypothetical protein
MRRLARQLIVISFTAAIATVGLSARAGQAAAAAPSQNIKTMAGILAGLNHFPSADEKKTLQGIDDSATATAPEKTLAEALLHVQHTVPAADKTKLEAVTKDQSTPESARTIAGILLHLNHTPSDTEKADLKKIAGM